MTALVTLLGFESGLRTWANELTGSDVTIGKRSADNNYCSTYDPVRLCLNLPFHMNFWPCRALYDLQILLLLHLLDMELLYGRQHFPGRAFFLTFSLICTPQLGVSIAQTILYKKLINKCLSKNYDHNKVQNEELIAV